MRINKRIVRELKRALSHAKMENCTVEQGEEMIGAGPVHSGER